MLKKTNHIFVSKFQQVMGPGSHRLSNGTNKDQVRNIEVFFVNIFSNRKATDRVDIRSIWEQRDNAAQLYITSTIDIQQLRKLINCKTAKEIWERLTSQYEIASTESKHHLLRKFFDYSYQQELDIMSHITAIETMANQVKDFGSNKLSPR